MTMHYDETTQFMKIAKSFMWIAVIITLIAMTYIYLRASILIFMGWI